jgi:hypothetical protein
MNKAFIIATLIGFAMLHGLAIIVAWKRSRHRSGRVAVIK